MTRDPHRPSPIRYDREGGTHHADGPFPDVMQISAEVVRGGLLSPSRRNRIVWGGNPTRLLAGLAITLVVVATLYVNLVIWPREIVDMLAYRHAAGLLRAGGVGLYDSSLLPDGVWPYLYPPGFAALVAPIFLLPEAIGNVLWGGVVAASAVASFWALHRLASLGATRMTLLAFALAPALGWLLIMGQVDAVAVALLALALMAFERDRVRTSGALIGLAGMIKVIPVLALLPFLVRRQWRVVGAAVVSLGALSLLPLPWLVAEAGFVEGVNRLVDLHIAYAHEVVLLGIGTSSAETWLRLPWNASLPATALRLGGAAALGSLVMWLMVGGGIAIAFAKRNVAIGVGLVVSGAALGNFVFWSHNVFVLALPLALSFTLAGAGMAMAGLVLVQAGIPVLGTVAYLGAWSVCAWKGASSPVQPPPT